MVAMIYVLAFIVARRVLRPGLASRDEAAEPELAHAS
jgi:hypothetical protein